ncbi:hypothetical protein ACFSUK_31450 [Sphingobium scionense]
MTRHADQQQLRSRIARAANKVCATSDLAAMSACRSARSRMSKRRSPPPLPAPPAASAMPMPRMRARSWATDPRRTRREGKGLAQAGPFSCAA